MDKEYCLIGVDGNAFSVMGYVTKAMRRENKTEEEIATYRDKAMESDYNNLLRISQDMVEELNGE